ncbi:Crp/Fnr family transcriptional regulator [Sedimentibacter sp. MB31-C6]|uniref:Crp/Fnr family transcriptional regulator n=1 Tax=Sedimentibacter sp. MB31-C6 TaxID=3109366 RepID=UPI002DDCA2AD|nr:Crp/Fnr family transcriptional regulator [Sedimentibacter sp. MB36-C1]WSI05174.1 Crp/Fnr family transcriptional regulator [Sedimentibacter sp. MB36-C1]
MIEGNELNLLNRLEFWTKLNSREQKNLIDNIEKKSFPKNKIVYEGLDDCKGLILVKSGQLRTFILSENGKEVTLYRLFEDDVCIMSASCALNNITFDVYIEAEKNSEILLIPSEIYMRLSENNIYVQKFTNEITLSRFSDVMWIMEQVLFMSFDKRLAIFLLEQSNIEKSNTLYITHEDIAKNIGSAREVVSRMLKYFQNEGYVKTERGNILITDKKKLLQLTT